MQSEWMLTDKIPIGDFIPAGKGQQWSYRLGYKDGQVKLLQHLIVTADKEGWLDSTGIYLQAMLKQIQGEGK
jgi:hypothetical protein